MHLCASYFLFSCGPNNTLENKIKICSFAQYEEKHGFKIHRENICRNRERTVVSTRSFEHAGRGKNGLLSIPVAVRHGDENKSQTLIWGILRRLVIQNPFSYSSCVCNVFGSRININSFLS